MARAALGSGPGPNDKDLAGVGMCGGGGVFANPPEYTGVNCGKELSGRAGLGILR